MRLAPRLALLLGLEILTALLVGGSGCWLVAGIDDKVLTEAGAPDSPGKGGGPPDGGPPDGPLLDAADAGCPQGYATCDSTAPCAARLADDPQNCGRCTRACQGCQSSECPVVFITSPGKSIPFLAQQNTLIFWTSRDPPAVTAAYKQPNSDLLGIVPEAGVSPVGIAVVNQNLYYTIDYEGFVGGYGPQGYSHLADGQQGAYGIAADPAEVFYTRLDSPGLQAGVWRVAADGGTPVEIAEKRQSPEGIVLDATHVYWVEAGDPGGIYSAPRVVGAFPSAVMPAKNPVGRLAIDDLFIYWASAAGDVLALTKDQASAQQTTLAQGQVVVDIATDGQAVFWTEANSGSVVRVNRDGTGLMTLAKKQLNPGAILVDDYDVYWVADDASGKTGIYRTHK